ncbi:MAG: hypothetical protein ACYTF0_08215 [Planctomycetota bacterium]
MIITLCRHCAIILALCPTLFGAETGTASPAPSDSAEQPNGIDNSWQLWSLKTSVGF